MSRSEIVIKKKKSKKYQSSSNTLDSSLTSNCYTDDSSSSECSTSSSPSKCSTSSSSTSSCTNPSIEVIEISRSSSSSSSSSSKNDCCGGKERKKYRRERCNRGCNGGCNGGCFRSITSNYGECYYTFYANVQPLSNFKYLDGSSNASGLKIDVTISNKLTTLQWPGFSGNVTSSGIPYVSIGQFFKGLPSYDVYSSFLINYQSGDALSTVQIVSNNSDTVRWYLQASRKSTGVSANSFISVYGGSVTFINNCNVC